MSCTVSDLIWQYHLAEGWSYSTTPKPTLHAFSPPSDGSLLAFPQVEFSRHVNN